MPWSNYACSISNWCCNVSGALDIDPNGEYLCDAKEENRVESEE